MILPEPGVVVLADGGVMVLPEPGVVVLPGAGVVVLPDFGVVVLPELGVVETGGNRGNERAQAGAGGNRREGVCTTVVVAA